jgi:hypothetical protein
MRLIGLVVLFAMWGGAVQAADFSAKILDMDGRPFVDDVRCPADTAGKRKCEDEVTLASIAVRALMANFPDEQNLPGEDKFKRFALAMKIKDGGEVAVSAEDVSLLKRLIGKLYTPLVVGRAFPLLDPAEVPVPRAKP